MNTLKPSSIKTKKDLYSYYLDQMSRDMIAQELIDVLKKTRENYKGKDVKYAQVLSLKEVVIFVANNDAPAGYVLDEEMQRRVDEYNRIYALKK